MRNYNKTNPWPGMAALALAASAMAGTAYAGIPAPALPAGVTASSDWLAVLKGYSQSGSSLLTLVLSVASNSHFSDYALWSHPTRLSKRGRGDHGKMAGDCR